MFPATLTTPDVKLLEKEGMQRLKYGVVGTQTGSQGPSPGS